MKRSFSSTNSAFQIKHIKQHSKLIKEDGVRSNDVLAGRGERSNEHNKHYRELIEQNEEAYNVTIGNTQKQEVAIRVVNGIKARNGRFLQQTKPNNKEYPWCEASLKEATNKVKQSFRDLRNNKNKNLILITPIRIAEFKQSKDSLVTFLMKKSTPEDIKALVDLLLEDKNEIIYDDECDRDIFNKDFFFEPINDDDNETLVGHSDLFLKPREELEGNLDGRMSPMSFESDLLRKPLSAWETHCFTEEEEGGREEDCDIIVDELKNNPSDAQCEERKEVGSPDRIADFDSTTRHTFYPQDDFVFEPFKEEINESILEKENGDSGSDKKRVFVGHSHLFLKPDGEGIRGSHADKLSPISFESDLLCKPLSNWETSYFSEDEGGGDCEF